MAQTRSPSVDSDFGCEEPKSLYDLGPNSYLGISVNDGLIADRYLIVDKLGWGGFSTVWLAEDVVLQRHVALKVGLADCSRSERELMILSHLATAPPPSWPILSVPKELPQGPDNYIMTPIHEFSIREHYGAHLCYTMDISHGDLWRTTDGSMFPIHVARAVATKLVLAVNYVHSKGVVHGDLRLQNALIRRPLPVVETSVAEHKKSLWPSRSQSSPEQGSEEHILQNVRPFLITSIRLGDRAEECTLQDAQSVVLSDFGEAFFPSTEQRYGQNIPFPRRAPEAIFEPTAPVSNPSDVWDLGLMLWEVLGEGTTLTSGTSIAEKLVSNQIDLLGYERFPEKWKAIWERDARGVADAQAMQALPRRPETYEALPSLEERFKETVLNPRRLSEQPGEFGNEEAAAILSMLRGMLEFDPTSRWTTQQVLQSDWVVKWGLPSLYPQSETAATEPNAPNLRMDVVRET